MNIIDNQYLNLLDYILKNGTKNPDRTGTGTISVFNPPPIIIDASSGRLPLITTRKIPYRSIFHECIWMFVKGDTNISYLKDNNVNIWNSWADKNNNLGPIYGANFRRFQGFTNSSDGSVTPVLVDQIQNVILSLRDNPHSRRHVISGWNPSTTPIEGVSFSENVASGRSALPQCHSAFIQFYVNSDNSVDMFTYTRSNDVGTGLLFNLCMSTILLRMITQCSGHTAGKITYMIGDAHIYADHLEGVHELLQQPIVHDSPVFELDPSITNFNNFTFDSYTLKGYDATHVIKFPISV